MFVFKQHIARASRPESRCQAVDRKLAAEGAAKRENFRQGQKVPMSGLFTDLCNAKGETHSSDQQS